MRASFYPAGTHAHGHHPGAMDALILIAGFALLGIVWVLGITLLALRAARFL